jgi:hypothetical protein
MLTGVINLRSLVASKALERRFAAAVLRPWVRNPLSDNFVLADNPGIDGDAPFTRTYADAPLQTLDQRDSGR